MRRVRDENGYALLLVLLLIVFITILTAVFLRSSISNAKQEHIVDKNHLTVNSAETGIDYYKSYFSNIYYNSISELEAEATRLIDIQKNNNNNKNKPTPIINYTYVQESVNNMLLNKMNNGISNLTGTIERFGDKKTFSFSPDSLKAEKSSNGTSVKITGTVKGVYRDGEIVKILNFIQEFKTITFDPTNSSVKPPEGAETGIIDIKNLYPGNAPNSNCSNKKIDNEKCKFVNGSEIKEIEDSVVYLPNGYINENQGNIKIEESTIYSNGPLHVKNMNELDDSYLYINGFFKAKNMNDVEDTTLVINGAMNIESNIEFEESHIVVNGNAKIDGHLDIEDSKVCIAGSLEVGKTLSIDEASTLYHSGSIKYKKLDGETKNIVKLSTANEVLDKCKIVNSGGISKEKWLPPSIDVTYQ